MSNTLSCCSQLLRLAPGTLSLSIVRSLLFCPGLRLESDMDDINSTSCSCWEGGEKKTVRERRRKQKKKRKRKERQNNRRDLHCQSPGGECWVLRVTTCWVTEGFVWSDSCVVGSVGFQSCQGSKKLIFIWEQRHVRSVASLLQRERSLHSVLLFKGSLRPKSQLSSLSSMLKSLLLGIFRKISLQITMTTKFFSTRKIKKRLLTVNPVFCQSLNTKIKSE